MRRLSLFAVVLGLAAAVCRAQGPPVVVPDLCSLTTNISAYHGRRVRVKAFLGVGPEQDVLYDPKCQDGKPLVYAVFNPTVRGQMKTLRRIVVKKHYALVTVEGVIRGPEPVSVDPKLPDWLKERFKNSVKRYGHLNSLEMMIEIERVVTADDVDDGSSKAESPSELSH